MILSKIFDEITPYRNVEYNDLQCLILGFRKHRVLPQLWYLYKLSPILFYAKMPICPLYEMLDRFVAFYVQFWVEFKIWIYANIQLLLNEIHKQI